MPAPHMGQKTQLEHTLPGPAFETTPKPCFPGQFTKLGHLRLLQPSLPLLRASLQTVAQAYRHKLLEGEGMNPGITSCA